MMEAPDFLPFITAPTSRGTTPPPHQFCRVPCPGVPGAGDILFSWVLLMGLRHICGIHPPASSRSGVPVPAFRSGVWSSAHHPGAYLLKFKLFQPRRVVHISPAEIAPAGQIPALQAPRAPPQAPRPPGEYLQQSHPRQDSPSRHHHQARQAHPAAPAAPG